MIRTLFVFLSLILSQNIFAQNHLTTSSLLGKFMLGGRLIDTYSYIISIHPEYEMVGINSDTEIFKEHKVTLERPNDGLFANTITLIGTHKTNTCWKVVDAYFVKQPTWGNIKALYDTWKEDILIPLYGQPVKDQSIEYMPVEYKGYEYEAIKNRKAGYILTFETNEGTVTLEIEHYPCVTVKYYDNESRKLAEEENQNQ